VGRPAASVMALAMLLAPAFPLRSQPNIGEIRLTVRDPSGAAMRVSGKLENRAGGGNRNFQTDAQGACTISGVPYGRYRLVLSRRGFATEALSIEVNSAVPIARTIAMTLGAATDTVEVVATTPLAGVDLSRRQIAAPVETGTARDIADSGALDLPDFLNRRLDAVNINEMQGNPFQPDVDYRGYTASPLLGTPQGLSVYMDGVRLNQPFGDIVSWDLIPRVAIAEVSLMPGSNPIFGLNTLGGALSVQTKDGRSDAGTALTISGGSYGRKSVEWEHGGSNSRGLDWYLAGTLFFEDGWREASPSAVRQFFGKLGWQRGNTKLTLTLSYAGNSLTGNGLEEQRLLAQDYASVYTVPDLTVDRAPFVSLGAHHSFGDGLSFSGNLYYRFIGTGTLNGDLNADSLGQDVYTSGSNASNTPFPYLSCLAQVLEQGDADATCDGLLTRTDTEQHNFGLSGQLTRLGSLDGRHNQFTVGAAYDGSVVNFTQSSQYGYLNSDRSVTAVNAFDQDTRVDLHGLVNTGSVYATDTFTAGKWDFTLSGRYNRTGIDNTDRLQPLPGSGSLTAGNSFGRFNPAAGIAFNPSSALGVYFGYTEGSRTPTSIELGCSDPTQPCKLPNSLAGDPPLKQVVTRTLEAGLRGDSEGRLHWSAGWFRAENYNDILFAASTETGFGYFKNFGKTLRQGVEISANGRIRRLSLGGGYTFLDATYRTAETVDGTSNSTNASALAGLPGVEGVIQIQPGDRIPLIPRQMLKAYAGLQATGKLSIDLDFVAASSSYARGNENNLNRPDGIYYLGPGISPGYGVVNLGARYQLRPRVEFFVQMDNLLDHRYYTAAQLGSTGFTAQGTITAQPLPAILGVFPVVSATFYAPGAPFGVWGGIRFRF